MATVTISDDALGRAVSLISAFCGNPLGVPAAGSSTSAKTSAGEGTVTGLAACATALAAVSPAAADLLGRTTLEQAQVSEWLTWCTTELALLLDDKLVKVCASVHLGVCRQRCRSQQSGSAQNIPPPASLSRPAPLPHHAPHLPPTPKPPHTAPRSTSGSRPAPTWWATASPSRTSPSMAPCSPPSPPCPARRPTSSAASCAGSTCCSTRRTLGRRCSSTRRCRCLCTCRRRPLWRRLAARCPVWGMGQAGCTCV